jgi:uncharacterized membrane protein
MMLGTFRRLCADGRGGAAVLLAVAMPVVVGGFGLGAEAGYWYFNQRKLQKAADMAAFAAGVELREGHAEERI